MKQKAILLFILFAVNIMQPTQMSALDVKVKDTEHTQMPFSLTPSDIIYEYDDIKRELDIRSLIETTSISITISKDGTLIRHDVFDIIPTTTVCYCFTEEEHGEYEISITANGYCIYEILEVD